MTKTCQMCGKKFETDEYWIRFCSHECYEAFRESKDTETRVCEVCGDLYRPVRGNQKYCCKTCREKARKARERQYYEAHREEIKERARQWRINHRSRRNRISRDYYQRHRQEILDKFKEKRVTEHESVTAKEQAYREAHREEKREYNRYCYNVKPKIEACSKAHNGCFDCPTEDGECLYD